MELRRYWEIICRRKWLLLAVAALIPFFTYVLLKDIPPVYQSKGKIWVQMTALSPKYLTALPSQLGQLTFSDSDNALGTIEELLNSEAVVGSVIKNMDLRNAKGRFFTADEFINPGRLKLSRQKYGVYIKKITDSDVFEVVGYSRDPEHAQQIAEGVIAAFQTAFADLYHAEARNAFGVLRKSLADVGGRLRAAELKLSEYRLANNLPYTDEQKKSIINEISTLETSNKASLEISLAKVLTTKTPSHPDAKTVINQIQDVDGQIALLKKQLDDITVKTRREDELSRDVTNLKSVFTTLSTNIEAAKSASIMSVSQAFSIQAPVTYADKGQNQYFPPKKMKTTLLVSFLAAVFMALFLVFLIDYLDDSVWSRDDLALDGRTLFITVPRGGSLFSKKADRESRIKDSVCNLSAMLEQVRSGGDDDAGEIITVVSPAHGDGRTVMSAFLASALATQGKKTLLVDGDLRHPSIHTLFEIPADKGLADCLADGGSPDAAVVHPVAEGLSLMTAGTPDIPYPQLALASAKLGEVLKALMAKYDRIVVDTPSPESGPDALILSKYAKRTVFVVSQGMTDRSKAAAYLGELSRAAITVSAVVMNNCASSQNFFQKLLRNLFRRRRGTLSPARQA